MCVRERDKESETDREASTLSRLSAANSRYPMMISSRYAVLLPAQ